MSVYDYVDGIWRMLDEMALSDPSGYHKFVSERIKLKPSLPSKPRCRGFQKCTSHGTSPLILWKCLYGGCRGNGIRCNASVGLQYRFPRDRPNIIKQSLEVDQLVALIILYLQHEKSIPTQEGDVIHERKNLPKFATEWSNQPHGGDDLMLESLSYKKSLTDFAIYSPIETKDGIWAPPLAFQSHAENRNRLIEEIKPQPCWQLNQTRKVPNTYECTIQLPPGTRMEDCELDISPRRKDIGIYAFRVDIYKRVKGGYNTETNQKRDTQCFTDGLFRW
uniref:PIH1 domain-containing protein n=1 Tax=Taenia asiatica TaxID=60517 RepID=A0A0R3W5W8_TAEAS